jgi:hypothetical protein
MNVEIGAEAALFPEKEYISRIFVAVYNTNMFYVCKSIVFMVFKLFCSISVRNNIKILVYCFYSPNRYLSITVFTL